MWKQVEDIIPDQVRKSVPFTFFSRYVLLFFDISSMVKNSKWWHFTSWYSWYNSAILTFSFAWIRKLFIFAWSWIVHYFRHCTDGFRQMMGMIIHSIVDTASWNLSNRYCWNLNKSAMVVESLYFMMSRFPDWAKSAVICLLLIFCDLLVRWMFSATIC